MLAAHTKDIPICSSSVLIGRLELVFVPGCDLRHALPTARDTDCGRNTTNQPIYPTARTQHAPRPSGLSGVLNMLVPDTPAM